MGNYNSTHNNTQKTSNPNLTGIGAAYIRVSTDAQDTQRQYAGVAAFEKRFAVSIGNAYRFEDFGYARDQADRRPEFLRMMKLATAGRIQWIVVDKLDRFGTKDKWQLAHFVYELREAGCRLYDVSGKDWTAGDILAFINAGIEAEQSEKEQRGKSYRSLGGMIEKARNGEWMGGAVRFGFDIGCFDRSTGKEVWRVVMEGKYKRLKVFPGGKTERYDGKGNFPQCLEEQALRVTPSKDPAKLEAVQMLFTRYATENIAFNALSRWLNSLGFRNSFGGDFVGDIVAEMLRDPVYLGFPTFNKYHRGKFNHYANGELEEVANYRGKETRNTEADWIQPAKRLFPPLIQRDTWEKVQRKLRTKTTTKRPMKSPAVYLSGLIYCGGCGGLMSADGKRKEYFCSTYHKHVTAGTRAESPCLRNGVFQSEVEPLIEQWLRESEQRLEIVGGGDIDALTDPIEQKTNQQYGVFWETMERIINYLATHHPKEWAKVRQHGYQHFNYNEVLNCYRACFQPETNAGELARLEAEHDALTNKALNLTTGRAIEKVNQQLSALEQRITNLEQQQQDIADIAETQLREWRDLVKAIRNARTQMGSKGERGIRQRAEALRAVIHRIECQFKPTGKKGWGNRSTELQSVTIHPVTGETAIFPVSYNGTTVARGLDILLTGIFRKNAKK